MYFTNIQNIVFPSIKFGAPVEMYVRTNNDNAIALLSENKILFKESGHISFDTFFNSINLEVWKKHTHVNDLHLTLEGTGKYVLNIGLHRLGHSQRWLEESIIDLDVDGSVTIPVNSWGHFDSGMLYFSLFSLSDGILTKAYFSTTTFPEKKAKLGIVITHFNRKEYVVPAIKRLDEELLNDSYYKDKIALIIVDNSNNIKSDECYGSTVIPNKNLGGAGGFTRGLLHLKDSSDFTHCLFMDDDASCETESIRRAYQLISYSKTEKFAISGSLIREVEPYRMMEKGAKFDGVCKPLKSGLDMRNVHDLLIADLEDHKPDFGGWWFFAFCIEDVIEYPFPFFVRGDDSRFSIKNKFNICTTNSICCWGDDFSLKSSPSTFYLDARYHLLHLMLIFNKNSFNSLKIIMRMVFDSLYSYNYGSAKACIMAINHVSTGPGFFVKNIDMQEVRGEITKLSLDEKMSPIIRSDHDVVYGISNKQKIKKVWRSLLLNGFLLPNFILSNETVFQHKSFYGNSKEIFSRKKVLYEYEPSGIGYVAYHDKKKFYLIAITFFYESFLYIIKYKKIKNNYKKEINNLTSQEFWRTVYNGNKI